MAIFIIVLDNTSHQLNNHFVEIHPDSGTLSVTKVVPEYIEALEPPVKCLLVILGSFQKLLKIGGMLIFCDSMI